MSAMLDYMQLCRLCLVKEKVNVPIFGDDNDVRQIFLKITACLPVKVTQEDNLPKKICDACLYKVDLLYQFWNTTVNAEKQLIQWLTEIGVDVNIKNSDSQTLPILPQSHAHPHSIPAPVQIVTVPELKQERPDIVEKPPEFQIPEQPNLYSGYDNLGYPQAEVTMEVGATNNFVQPEPAEEPPPPEPPAPTPKKRGRPAGTTNKKTAAKKKPTPAPPVVVSPRTNSTRRSSATAAAAAVAAAAAAATDSEEDSDADDRLGGMDYNDSDSDEDHVTKEEIDSDEDYEVKPKSFLGVPSSADGEQPGPSGLGGVKTEASGANATESGFDVKLPEGIRIKKNTSNDDAQKQKVIKKTPTNTVAPRNKTTSIYEEVMEKLSAIPSIKFKKEEPPQKNMSSIVDNLAKCGLIVKKVETTENNPVQLDDNDDDNESEYEIETLDDEDDDDEDSSDMEYVPNSSQTKKRSPKGRPRKETVKSDGTKKPEKKSKNKEFIKIQSTNYLCIMCNEKFPSFDMLTKHMTSGVPCRVVTISCPICGKEFPSRSRCSSHISSTHKEKPKYHCTKCSKFFSNPVTLQIHEELNHTEYFDATDNGFKCKMCPHEAENRRLILHHINQNHLHVSTLLCDICGKSFLNENGLRNHIQTHRETKSYLCQICSKAFKMKSSLRAHIKTHDTERSFVCDECGKSFKKKCTLSEHKKYHAGDFSFPCNWCSKKFVSRSLLNTHMKNHSA